MKLTIESVDNGWIVTAGCMCLVFTDLTLISDEFRRWILHPRQVEEAYVNQYEKVPRGEVEMQKARIPDSRSYPESGGGRTQA